MFEKGLISSLQFGEFLEGLEAAQVKQALIALLDIDDSKKVPSEQQEEVFQQLAHQVAAKFPNQIVSRVGRDCYAVMFLNQNVSYFEVANLKNELQRELAQQPPHALTFCMGMAAYPATCHELPDLYSMASEALFEAKKRGIDQIGVPSEEPMKMKASYFRKGQLVKLAAAAKKFKKTEAYLLRRALDEYLQKLERFEDDLK